VHSFQLSRLDTLAGGKEASTPGCDTFVAHIRLKLIAHVHVMASALALKKLKLTTSVESVHPIKLASGAFTDSSV
jgi:hypothetical protein